MSVLVGNKQHSTLPRAVTLLLSGLFQVKPYRAPKGTWVSEQSFLLSQPPPLLGARNSWSRTWKSPPCAIEKRCRTSGAQPGSPWLLGPASPPPLLDAEQTCAEATAPPGCNLPSPAPSPRFTSHQASFRFTSDCHSFPSVSGSPSPIGRRPWALGSFLRLCLHPCGSSLLPETPAGGFSHCLQHPASQPPTHSCFSPGFRLQILQETSHFLLLSPTPISPPCARVGVQLPLVHLELWSPYLSPPLEWKLLEARGVWGERPSSRSPATSRCLTRKAVTFGLFVVFNIFY